jgi:hypothetical protein
MIQIIVIVASILLGMCLYPTVKNAYTRFITEQYNRLNGETSPAGSKEEKTFVEKGKKNEITSAEKRTKVPIKTVAEQDVTPSIIGKSKFILSQSKPKAATDSETEKRAEKESIFAPGTGESTPLPEMEFREDDLEIEYDASEICPDDIGDNEEEASPYTSDETYSARGASFEELMQIKDAVEKPALSEEEKRTAGKILYEQQETELVEKLISGSQRVNLKVSALIKFHLEEHEKEQQLKNETDEEVKDGDEEFERFDFNQIFS